MKMNDKLQDMRLKLLQFIKGNEYQITNEKERIAEIQKKIDHIQNQINEDMEELEAVEKLLKVVGDE